MHTPGPWRVGDAGLTVFGPPNGKPAPARIASLANNAVNTRDNARLIAAAPDMLEALRLALPALDECYCNEMEGAGRCAPCIAYKAGSEAIPKAEGRTP